MRTQQAEMQGSFLDPVFISDAADSIISVEMEEEWSNPTSTLFISRTVLYVERDRSAASGVDVGRYSCFAKSE